MEQLKLDNQLCFKYYVISKEIIKRYKPLLKPLGLTYTGYITMLVLWETSPINQKTLGQTLTLDSGTLTPLLKKLEKQGLLTRKRSKKDERNVMIALSNKGQRLQQQAKDIPYLLTNSIFKDKGFSEAELKEKTDALQVVFELLRPEHR
jgi:DNA-binding MarR family transcriptional regulator